MAMKRFCQLLILTLHFFFNLPGNAQNTLGQTLQISTHFLSIVGKPEWLLELREMETGRILPYLYEVKENDNFWIAFSTGRSYRVIASTLKFGPYAKIANFCQLQNGIIEGKSMSIILTGELSPDKHRFKCKVSIFKDSSTNFANASPD